MLIKSWIVSGMMFVAAAGTVACACGGSDGTRCGSSANVALTGDSKTASETIAALRKEGPAGLAKLMKQIESMPHEGEAWEQMKATLDAVAMQKDAWASGLYWYTDLEQAKAKAKELHKPILSLRLLGNLNEDYSCANSRFFRTALYSNHEVSQYLRDHFVLHWQSHRPVPRITIDMGDGRKIERTITGNSAHYVLNHDGQVVDVLPGLYGPAAFLRELKDLESILDSNVALVRVLSQYHESRRVRTLAAWQSDLMKAGVSIPMAMPARKATATEAARVAIAKRVVELPMVKSVVPERMVLEKSSDQQWEKVAALHADDALLDESSIQLIRSKNPSTSALRATTIAPAKSRAEFPMVRLVSNFQRSIAEDTVRNEYTLHLRVHEWFANGQVPATFDELNEKVYTDLFLMPSTDPWLGLVPDAFTALPNDGLSAK